MRGLDDQWPGRNSILRLYPPCVVDRLHEVTTKIKVQGCVFMIHVDRNNSGRRLARVRGVSLVIFSAGRISLTLTGCSICVGGSVDCSDWPCTDCTVDFSPGEVGISYIRQELWNDSLIDAAPVTRSLIALSDCLIVFCTAGFSSKWTFCSTDFVLSAGFVLYVHRVDDCRNMAADGAALAEMRAGITLGVELYVPWDAPEAAVDISSEGVVPIRNISDVIGLVGRREGAAESRVLQGRDVRSVRVLVPDGRGVDQNFHDVTIVDMGEVPESSVSIPELSALSQQWPPAVISHMGWSQQELEEMRSAAKRRFRQSRPSNCVYCGSLIKCDCDMYRHVARFHLDLAQLWRCPLPQCRGVPSGRARLRIEWTTCAELMMFRGRSTRPAWRSIFRRGQLPGRCGRIRCLLSGISTDVLLFSDIHLSLVHHYRIHKRGLPHIAFRRNYLSQLRALLPLPVACRRLGWCRQTLPAPGRCVRVILRKS